MQTCNSNKKRTHKNDLGYALIVVRFLTNSFNCSAFKSSNTDPVLVFFLHHLASVTKKWLDYLKSNNLGLEDFGQPFLS